MWKLIYTFWTWKNSKLWTNLENVCFDCISSHSLKNKRFKTFSCHISICMANIHAYHGKQKGNKCKILTKPYFICKCFTCASSFNLKITLTSILFWVFVESTQLNMEIYCVACTEVESNSWVYFLNVSLICHLLCCV